MSQPFRNSYLFAAIITVIGAILFSTKAVLIKLAYQHPIDSLSLLSLRMLFSLPFFIGMLLFRKSTALDSPIQAKDWLKMAAIGISGFYCASYLDFIGLQYISASLERMVLYIYPTLVLIISAIFFQKKITKIQYVALFLSYVGVAIIFSGKISTVGNSNPMLGAFFVFFAALTYAIFIVGSGQLLPRIGTRRFTSYSMIAAAIAVIVHNTIANGFDLLKYPLEIYGIVLFMAIFATVLPTFLIAEGIRIFGANNSSIIGTIGPVSTIVLAYIFLGERLYLMQMLGTLFVISGVLLITLNKHSEKRVEKRD